MIIAHSKTRTESRPRQCREYRGAPPACAHPVLRSADGSVRCTGCHLHPDLCTCGRAGRSILDAIIAAIVGLSGGC